MSDTLTVDQPQVSEGALDFFANLILKGIKINFPGDREKLKAFIKAGGEWLKTTADVPGNLDDYAIDKIIDLIQVYVASEKEKAEDPSGPMIVGAVMDSMEYTAAEAGAFLSAFSDQEVPAESREKVKNNPKVLKSLKGLSRKQQITVLNSQDLLDMLIKYGPFVLRIVMLLISFI